MAKREAASTGPSQRQLRVGEEIRRVLARVVDREGFDDPMLVNARITISEVNVSPDLKNATVFIVPLGEGEDRHILEALKWSAGRLSGRIAREVNLKYAPRLSFKRDTAFETSSRIDALLNNPSVQRDIEAAKQREAEDQSETPDGA